MKLNKKNQEDILTKINFPSKKNFFLNMMMKGLKNKEFIQMIKVNMMLKKLIKFNK